MLVLRRIAGDWTRITDRASGRTIWVGVQKIQARKIGGRWEGELNLTFWDDANLFEIERGESDPGFLATRESEGAGEGGGPTPGEEPR